MRDAILVLVCNSSSPALRTVVWLWLWLQLQATSYEQVQQVQEQEQGGERKKKVHIHPSAPSRDFILRHFISLLRWSLEGKGLYVSSSPSSLSSPARPIIIITYENLKHQRKKMLERTFLYIILISLLITPF